jgi:tetratricopeptide (TPR) repeat protein
MRGPRRIAGAALLLVAAVAGSEAGAEAQDPRMVEIVDLIRVGKRTEAVGRANAMIATFAAAQHQPGVSYFCNRDRGGVANLMVASAGGRKVDLAPEAWCEALYAKGFALTDLKRFDEAAAALAQAVAMDPSNPHFLTKYGDVLRLKGDAPAAIRLYSKAYDLAAAEGEPGKAMATRALRGMALASEANGDLVAAQGYNERLLEQDAADVEARARLAEIARRRAAASTSPAASDRPPHVN